MDLKQILKSVELFDGLSDAEIDQVMTLCQTRTYAEGETIAFENTPTDELYIIEDGFVEVVRDSHNGNLSNVIVNLGPGQTIGEMTLIEEDTGSGTVRALNEPTILQAITQQDFAELCERYTHIGYVVMRNIAADLSFQLRRRALTEKRA